MTILEREVTEAQFQRQVIQLAQLCGWRVAHFRPAMNAKGEWRTPVAADGAGFPDLVLVRGHKLLFRELKTETGSLTVLQERWGEELRLAGADWGVWRPSDWPVIEQLLKRRGAEGLE